MRRLTLLAAALLPGCALVGGHRLPGASAPFTDNFDGDGPLGGQWLATSGALVKKDGAACGKNDVLRVVTKRSDFRDFELSLALLNKGLGETGRTPAVAWDGVHVFVRYQSQYHLYAVTLNRRDDTVVIKKKIPGGPSNDGTYFNLTPDAPYKVPYGEWQRFRVRVADQPDGSVSIELFAEGEKLLSAVDDGAKGGAPIKKAGKVGVRGDNCDFELDDFSVEPLYWAR